MNRRVEGLARQPRRGLKCARVRHRQQARAEQAEADKQEAAQDKTEPPAKAAVG